MHFISDAHLFENMVGFHVVKYKIPYIHTYYIGNLKVAVENRKKTNKETMRQANKG